MIRFRLPASALLAVALFCSCGGSVATEALREGLAIVREGGEAEVRGRLLAATAQLGWEAVAPRYDPLFEEVVGEARNGAHAGAHTRELSPGRDPGPRTGATRGAPRAP